MSMTFRVEAFIIPSLNRETTSENIIDDVKVAKLLRENNSPRKLECINEDSEYSDNSILEKSSQSIIQYEESGETREQVLPSTTQCEPLEREEINEPIYDVPFSCRGKLSANVKKSANPVKEIPHHINPPITDIPIIEINYVQSDEGSDPSEAVAEPIYDVPYYHSKNREPSRLIKKLETAEFVSMGRNEYLKGSMLPLSRPPFRSSSLMSIDERGETPDDCDNQFCQHGLKNGCTTTRQRPEEVTEEIFEVNWMKRLESLRAREAVIKDKEAMLFDRERLLFKKEKELRILERLIKDKLKHLELCSKRFKHINTDGSLDELSERSESRGSKQSLERRLSAADLVEPVKSVQMTSPKGSSVPKNAVIAPVKYSDLGDGKILPERIAGDLIDKTASGKMITPLNDRVGCEGVRSGASVVSEAIFDGKTLNNPPNSRSSLVISHSGASTQSTRLPHPGRGSSIGYSGHSSMRRKRRPKISYDDLDSTLSADIGDSSYVVTSRIFNPAVFKKPQAFTRSASERKSVIEEEKVLKRLSENILVSQDRGTKFQDYGMIDLDRENGKGEEDDKRFSYLNLEKGPSKTKERGKKDEKERPVSWSEEQNAWLQRKRMAYNFTMRRKPVQHSDKENLQRTEEVKKKVSMVKKFSIFR